MNKDRRFFKPLGLIISSSLTVVFALVAFIITAVNSTYDDGYGVSYSYGNKDLLVIILSSIVALLLGVVLLSNSLEKRKTEEWTLPAFMVASSMIFSFFMLGSILKPAFNNEVEFTTTYIINIVATIVSLIAFVIGIIVLAFTLLKKNQYQSLILSYAMIVCYILSLVIYCMNQGIAIISETVAVGIMINDLIVGICFVLIDVSVLLEGSMLSLQLRDSRLR